MSIYFIDNCLIVVSEIIEKFVIFQVQEIATLFGQQMSVYFNAVRDEPYILGNFYFLN
jgi:hypothetical protein